MRRPPPPPPDHKSCSGTVEETPWRPEDRASGDDRRSLLPFETMAEVTHVAYADETNYNTGQFRGVAAISLALTDESAGPILPWVLMRHGIACGARTLS